MRAVIQRVSRCQVAVAGETIARIERGFLVLLGIRTGDTAEQARWLADKIVGLRVFDDGEGKMKRSQSGLSRGPGTKGRSGSESGDGGRT